MQAEWDDPSTRAVSFEWDDLVVESVRDDANAARVGRSVTELAAERGAAGPLDAFLDVSLERASRPSGRPGSPTWPGSSSRTWWAPRSPTRAVVPGSSDGGAHLASFTGADYTTRLLCDWVPEALTLEQAVWRNTLMPASIHGLTDRGVLREGARADVLVIDPSRLAADPSRLLRDFPAGTERYVVESHGYRATLVNGQVLLEDGKHTGALPGEVIRGV